MKLTGNLKKKAEQSESREAKQAAIERAGMLLTDDELDAVAGGNAVECYSSPDGKHKWKNTKRAHGGPGPQACEYCNRPRN